MHKSDATDQQTLNTNEDCKDTDEGWNLEMWTNNYRAKCCSVQSMKMAFEVIQVPLCCDL